MPFSVSIRGRRVVFDSGPDGRWNHNLSPTEAILAGGDRRAAYDGAEAILWALSSGLANEESATILNKVLAHYTRKGDGGAAFVFHMQDGDPICVRLVEGNEGYVPEGIRHGIGERVSALSQLGGGG